MCRAIVDPANEVVKRSDQWSVQPPTDASGW
jgi:hypothetical protein